MQFEMFYETKYTGRKLSWLHHMSLGEYMYMYMYMYVLILAKFHTFVVTIKYNF